jgi:hypothetical protein
MLFKTEDYISTKFQNKLKLRIMYSYGILQIIFFKIITYKIYPTCQLLKKSSIEIALKARNKYLIVPQVTMKTDIGINLVLPQVILASRILDTNVDNCVDTTHSRPMDRLIQH